MQCNSIAIFCPTGVTCLTQSIHQLFNIQLITKLRENTKNQLMLFTVRGRFKWWDLSQIV
jgi:hypothetical protein